MARFIFRRSIYSIVALLGATMIVFGLSRAVGDPRDLYIQEGGYGTSAETRAVLEKQLNLDRPLAVQYSIWVGRVLRGDMGDSVFTRIPVSRQIMESGPRTLRLGIVSWILATGMGIPLGIIAAVYRGTYIDKLSRTFALLGQAAPPFWIGIMAILLFSVKLRWLPAGTEGDGLAIRNYVMPAFTLGWLAAAGYMRITRSAMLEVLDSEFVKLARKGRVRVEGGLEARLSQCPHSAAHRERPAARRIHHRRGRGRDGIRVAWPGPPGGRRRVKQRLPADDWHGPRVRRRLPADEPPDRYRLRFH